MPLGASIFYTKMARRKTASTCYKPQEETCSSDEVTLTLTCLCSGFYHSLSPNINLSGLLQILQTGLLEMVDRSSDLFEGIAVKEQELHSFGRILQNNFLCCAVIICNIFLVALQRPVCPLIPPKNCIVTLRLIRFAEIINNWTQSRSCVRSQREYTFWRHLFFTRVFKHSSIKMSVPLETGLLVLTQFSY